MSAIILLALAVVLSVGFAQLGRNLFKNSKNEGIVMAVSEITAGSLILALAPFFNWSFTTDLKLWGALLLSCIFYAMNDRFGATVKKHLDVSYFTIIRALSTVFLVLVGIFVFKESVTPEKIIGMALIILGNILVMFRGFQGKINKYFLLAILVEIVLTVALSIGVGISTEFNFPVYVALTLAIPGFMNLLIGRKGIKKIRENLKGIDKKLFWIHNIFWGVLGVTLLSVYAMLDMSIVAPVFSTATLFSVFIGVFIFGEKEMLGRKIIAAILAVAGIIFLSVNMAFI